MVYLIMIGLVIRVRCWLEWVGVVWVWDWWLMTIIICVTRFLVRIRVCSIGICVIYLSLVLLCYLSKYFIILIKANLNVEARTFLHRNLLYHKDSYRNWSITSYNYLTSLSFSLIISYNFYLLMISHSNFDHIINILLFSFYFIT